MTLEEREATLGGIGTARKRKEDGRFIRGQGNFVDDIVLPNLVCGDFVRSPYAHARIKSIDKAAALELPGVIAVLTADDLKPLSLHWMPTLAGDTAAVLADEKVHFQNQEVAFVIAEDRPTVADAIQLVEVDYEELPVLVDPNKAMDDGAPEGQCRPGRAQTPKPHFPLGSG
jgi:carbon-monoxide dehydrogenase large subunit